MLVSVTDLEGECGRLAEGVIVLAVDERTGEVCLDLERDLEGLLVRLLDFSRGDFERVGLTSFLPRVGDACLEWPVLCVDDTELATPRVGEGLRDLERETDGDLSRRVFDLPCLEEVLEVREVLEREETSELSVPLELTEDSESERSSHDSLSLELVMSDSWWCCIASLSMWREGFLGAFLLTLREMEEVEMRSLERLRVLRALRRGTGSEKT